MRTLTLGSEENQKKRQSVEDLEAVIKTLGEGGDEGESPVGELAGCKG